MADSIVDWVSDELHDILGLSDRYTAEYLVGLARKAPSTGTFLKQLEKTGAISINEAVTEFSQKLWQRVPHQTAIEKPARAREREAILQREKNKKYQLIMEGSDDEDEVKHKRRHSSSSSRHGESTITIMLLHR